MRIKVRWVRGVGEKFCLGQRLGDAQDWSSTLFDAREGVARTTFKHQAAEKHCISIENA